MAAEVALNDGDTLLNPVSGERLTLVRTPASTQGNALELLWRIPAGSRMVALPHRHPRNDEHFEILEGSARFSVAGQRREQSAPHSFVVTAGASHVHPANVGPGELMVRQWVELDEADDRLLRGVQRYFETVSALAARRKVSRIGLIRNPLQFAVTVSETLMPDTVLSFPPPSLQLPPLRAIAALARRLGLRGYHPPPAELIERATDQSATA